MSRQTDPRPRAPATGEQSPIRPTRINPDVEAKKVPDGAMGSRSYIPKFERLDTQPIEVVDDETAIRRNRQIIAICKRLCPLATKNASDQQILGLHRAFMAGRL